MPKTQDTPQSSAQKTRPWLKAVDALLVVSVLVAIGTITYRSLTNDDACTAIGQNHELSLNSDSFAAEKLTVAQCDTITIINNDSQNYSLAFGVHDKHVDYPGFTQTLLRPIETQKVDMVQAGNYRMHDHIRDNAHIDITVEAKK